MAVNKYIRWFKDVNSSNVNIVGGKNASLGEMISSLTQKKVFVPNGFATTTDAYWFFLEANDIKEKIKNELSKLNKERSNLQTIGKNIRNIILSADFPPELAKEIKEAYQKLGLEYKKDIVDVAVRSSATAEDLADASFAGQQETFLNVTGQEALLESCRKCFASLFTDRAIVYREEKGFSHMQVGISVGIQKMVRSDKAGSGVMFTLDTETGFPNVIVINAAWGLGENVVQGSITPDEYRVFKPLIGQQNSSPIIEKDLGKKELKMVYGGVGHETKNIETTPEEQDLFVLNNEEILKLAKWAKIIEEHYKKPMDIEWAKDGETGYLFIVQARPETVQSQKVLSAFRTYRLKEKAKPLVKGIAIGNAITTGRALIIKDAKEINRFKEGAILVTSMTDPDWVPIMKKASGIITDYGGRTSHAAIVSRELGVTAVIGTGNATKKIRDNQEITVSSAEGNEGFVYNGILKYESKEINLADLPKVKTQIMMNVANPDEAFNWWKLPTRGIGLARMEFIINNVIKIHPMALVQFEQLEDPEVKEEIEKITRGYKNKEDFFVEKLSMGIAKIAASQYPHKVIVRMSDFKTNEYADLIGGVKYEPVEENPMLGFRGASRYYNDRYRAGFSLECRAIKKVRNEIGLKNVIIMIPFCRTLEEADRVFEVLAENGLKRGEDNFEVYVMVEIPSNVILAEEFAEKFDGFSIGSNDLTQLVLGIDRDSTILADQFDERNEAVKRMISSLIKVANKKGIYVGICGQGPSDHPDFAEFLVREGINSISLNPDSVLGVIRHVAKVENERK